MFKRLGVITLPLIVLAGMRRCPVPRQNYNNYNMEGIVDGKLLSTSLTIVALGLIVAATVYMASRYSRKAV
jgi:hypothetical protein